MSVGKSKQPRCIVIAGRNGAGKTTFAREFLPKDAGVIRFVNADLIATGLSPLRPELAAVFGGRLLLHELDRLAAAKTDFAFETTLSGLTYLRRLMSWKNAGYRIEISYLRLPSPQLAVRRVAVRVKQGGLMFRAPTYSGVSIAAGLISRTITDCLRITGRCMIIPDQCQCSSKKGHENKN